MKFQEVAQVFNQIESISSRNEITQLLSELFKKTNPFEAKIICYFSLGTLNPPYIPSQFNFADKSAIKVIEKLLSISQEKIKEEFKKTGDLGSILETGSWRQSSSLTVEDVYAKLDEIQKIGGTGSQEQKLNEVLNLLNALDPISAKFIIRILTATLRLGFSDMTLIDSLSVMLVGDKSLKKEIENEYNLCADIGLIAYNAKQDGIDGIKKLTVQIGIPIRNAGAERLPNANEIIEKLGPCIAQPKLDGFRLQVHLDKTKPIPLIRLFSRNLIDMSYMFPDLIEAFLTINVENIICEGEAVSIDPHTGNFYPFQETVKRKRKYSIEQMASELPLKLYIFDILYLNNRTLFNLTHEQRRQEIFKIFEDKQNTIRIINEKKVNNANELEEYFIQNIEAGLEGLVVKRSDAIYQPGKRNFNWIKLKRHAKGELLDTIDCVILGYYHGSGKRAKFGLGAILVGIYNEEKDIFQTIAKVGSGLTDEGWIELKKRCDNYKSDHKPNNVICDKMLAPDVWVYPKIVCEIFADEITLSPVHTAGKTEKNLGFALRFPRFISYRVDKEATQTTSVKELFEMYDIQYNKK